MDKFQQGGILQKISQMPDKQKKAFLTQFAQWAQQNGLDIKQLQSDPQALEQAMTAFVQAMQGTQPGQQPVTAKLGAKLEYLRSLKGECPEGQQLVYFKQGGRVCKKCIEAAGGAKVKGKEAIDEFKKKACGGSKMKLEEGKKIQKPVKKEEKPQQRLDPKTTKKLPGGKYPSYWTSQERQTWERLHGDNDEGAAAVENKGIGKNKCGSKLKKHQQGGTISFFQPGGQVKRYAVSSTQKGGPGTRYFDTDEEAKAYQRTLPQGSSVRRDLGTEWKGSVLKADRTKDSATAYARQQAEAPYNKLSFKEAYNQARKNNVRWFAYKGKVYKSDLEGKGVKNNLTDMEAIYGNNLGWTNDPKMKSKASQQARAGYRKQIDAKKGNRNAVYKGKTNKQVSEEADRQVAKSWGPNHQVDFVDALFPTTAIGNAVSAATSSMMGEKWTPRIYASGFNPLGYGKALTRVFDGDVAGGLAEGAVRGVDAYATLGMPGAANMVDKGMTRFAPRLLPVSSKSKYIPRGGVENGTLSKWNWNSLARGGSRAKQSSWFKGTRSVTEGGRRSMQRAANEGFQFTGFKGADKAGQWATNFGQNTNTGTAYFFRGAPTSYDVAADRAVQLTPWLGAPADVATQQLYDNQ